MRALSAALFTAGFIACSCAAFAADSGPGSCSGPAKPFSPGAGDWNGWGVDNTNARFQPQPGLAAADVPKLKLKWAVGFGGQGDTRNQAQPVIVGGRVFVGSFSGKVYSLDASSGCIYWTYDAGVFVRGGVNIQRISDGGRARWVAFFGDGKGMAHAVDAETGAPVWKTQVDDFPVARITGTPTYYNGRLYVPVASGEELAAALPKYECCKFRGSLAALDAKTGRVIWKTFTIPDPPKAYKVNAEGTQLYGPAGAGVWGSPTIDEKRKRVYVGTGNSFTGIDMPTSDAVLAFDLESGSLLWSMQATPRDNWIPGCPKGASCPDDPGEDFDFGSSVMLRPIGGGKQIIVAPQKSGVIFGLDPDQRGKVVWQARVGAGGAQFGGFVWGAASEGRTVYAGFGENAPGTAGAPGLFALNIANGQAIRTPASATTPAGPAPLAPQALTAIPGVLFSGSLNGHLRAYSTTSGEVVWDFDALHDFDTVNGVAAQGGSFNGGGAAISHGMVVVNSGFGFGNGPTKPGNVLLAFSVDGK
jgi:polyvinyl alcohol dehydrogenase (cytochrome)